MDKSFLKKAAAIPDPINQVVYLCEQFNLFLDERPDEKEPAARRIYEQFYFALKAIYKKHELAQIYVGPLAYDIHPNKSDCYEFIRRTYARTANEITPILEERSNNERFVNLEAEVFSIFEAGVPESTLPEETLGLRQLYNRAKTLLDINDYAGVLHACGSMFELHAKKVCGDANLNDKSLGTFFEKYKKMSPLRLHGRC